MIVVKWEHQLTIDDPFDKIYWCPQEENCGLCGTRRQKEAEQRLVDDRRYRRTDPVHNH